MGKRKKTVGSCEEIVRTCHFCGAKGHPYHSERPWAISTCFTDLPAICPDCVEAGRTIAEIADKRVLLEP